VEGALVHVAAAGEQVGQDGDHVRNVVDSDSGAEQRVEGRRGAEVKAAESGDDGGDSQLRVEGNSERGVDL
jgi:hypothetical protein